MNYHKRTQLTIIQKLLNQDGLVVLKGISNAFPSIQFLTGKKLNTQRQIIFSLKPKSVTFKDYEKEGAGEVAADKIIVEEDIETVTTGK